MIDIKQVHKSFGNREILKGIYLHVPTDSVTVILGPFGSGKTTFLWTLDFLEKADAGTMQLNDISVDLHKASNKEILNVRRNTSMVFQSYYLFSNKTVIVNIMEGLVTVKKMKKSEARQIAQRFLKEVGMEGYDDYYPVQLSGGQQQCIGITRALAMDPEHKGKGYAREVLAEAEDLLRNVYKTPAVTLGTAVEHSWLTKMYESFGFKEYKRVQLPGKVHTTIFFKKTL